jgi:hypothetical protein
MKRGLLWIGYLFCWYGILASIVRILMALAGESNARPDILTGIVLFCLFAAGVRHLHRRLFQSCRVPGVQNADDSREDI